MQTTPAGVKDRCSELIELGVYFFMAAVPANLAAFELTPLGVTLKPLPFLTPGWNDDDLLRLWNQMDAHAFGPREMPMPNWVLVDHALMSSGLVIAACDPDRLDGILGRFGVADHERGILDMVLADAHAIDYAGPIPIAGYCAAPTAGRECWMGWSMCSAIPHAGLGFAVKALALEAYRAKAVIGVTQYDNLSLRSHVKFGPARIESAVVDLHTAPASLVYSSDIEAWRTCTETAADAAAAEPSFMVSAWDKQRHAELQELLDSGRKRLEIVEPGMVVRDGEYLVPVRVIDIEDGVTA